VSSIYILNIVYKLKNDVLVYEANYKNGISHGLYRSWGKNVYSEGNFVEGKGIIKSWAKNGIVSFEGGSINNKSVGLIRIFNEKGELKEEELHLIDGTKLFEQF
jgi:antitoxin component YwqK of YwqJK toxin-antitoxin module